jgi:hypothetical protein
MPRLRIAALPAAASLDPDAHLDAVRPRARNPYSPEFVEGIF